MLTLANVLWLSVKERRDILLRKFDHSDGIRPWMKYKEIDIISEILKKKKPRNCLEWGCGYSSLYFPKYLENKARWVAVEHDAAWYEKIKRLNIRPNTELNLLKPNHYPWTDENGDGAYQDLADYIKFPGSLGIKFDFILIDGQARRACLTYGRDVLAPDGIVVLHNANREYYYDALKGYPRQILFYEEGIDNGLWIGSTGLNIEDVLDVDKHTRIWDTSNKLRNARKSFCTLLKRPSAISR